MSKLNILVRINILAKLKRRLLNRYIFNDIYYYSQSKENFLQTVDDTKELYSRNDWTFYSVNWKWHDYKNRNIRKSFTFLQIVNYIFLYHIPYITIMRIIIKLYNKDFVKSFKLWALSYETGCQWWLELASCSARIRFAVQSIS